MATEIDWDRELADQLTWHWDHPSGGLVLHIHREVIHHGSEIALLRDLNRASNGQGIR